MADWTAKINKIEEISRKKDELNNEFMNQTKEALDAKMEHYEEKREAIITDLKEKLKVKTIIYLRNSYAACKISTLLNLLEKSSILKFICLRIICNL